MFLDGLDELDQKIVRLLIQNARCPTRTSARKWAYPGWR